MNSQDNTELIEVVLGLLEKSKQQDESIRKAIQALEREKNAIGTLKIDLRNAVEGQVIQSVSNAMEESSTKLEKQINRISGVVNKIELAKNDLDLRSNIWYFGGFALIFLFLLGVFLFLVPSIDEMRERRAELKYLNAKIEEQRNLRRLNTSKCGKKHFCVRVLKKHCNYGTTKDTTYCIADLAPVE